MGKIEKGTKFGKLTVLNFYKRIDYKTYYVCSCECDPEALAVVREYDLLSGHTKSCGCMRKINQFKSKNSSIKE